MILMILPLFNDTHFGSNKFNKNIFNTKLEFFQKQFFPYILENQVKDVVFLGDMVDNRNIIDLWILQELKSKFFQWFDDNHVTLHIIIGNHDTQFRNVNDYNFFNENVEHYEYIKVYNDPTVIRIGNYTIGMIPWITDTNNMDTLPRADILCGHFEIKNFKMMKNILSKDGLSEDIFKNYKYVFSGHFHCQSQRNNIIYPGTQYQINWNDFAEHKGFFVLKDDFEIDFIENTITPKFVKIYYTEKMLGYQIYDDIVKASLEEILDVAKNNYLKIFVKTIKNKEKFDAFLNNITLVSGNENKIDVVFAEDSFTEKDAETLEKELETQGTTLDISLAYIDSLILQEGIDKETLKDLMVSLYKETIEGMKE